jgi:predicted Rossmann-fold nucleotide-binding protein
MKSEIKNKTDLSNWLNNPEPAVFQGLDLIMYSDQILQKTITGCSFLGCSMTASLAETAAKENCLILPPIQPTDEAPFEPYSVSLYSPAELYSGYDPNDPHTYNSYLDRRIYLSYMDTTVKELLPVSADIMLLRRMHDATIAEALDDIVSKISTRIVAIMGGHDRGRNEPIYRDVALLGAQLARDGYCVATGGGPGLMEAANLGAYAAGFNNTQQVIDDALSKLSTAPLYNDPNWLKVGFEVWQEMGHPQLPEISINLGIPTWFYGHEPPNLFATDIAKYFENSVREEGLLSIARAGVIFAEGNGGTVQEIYQDACQNYYRTYAKVKSPMVLLGKDYWNPADVAYDNPMDKRKPVYPLLKKLAKEKSFIDYLLLTDSTQEAIEFIRSHPPTQ